MRESLVALKQVVLRDKKTFRFCNVSRVLTDNVYTFMCVKCRYGVHCFFEGRLK